MKINVYNTPTDDVKQHDIYILIDILRATSTITTLFYCEAKKVSLFGDIEKAKQQKEKDNNIILTGERNAIKVEGFDYGNSPLEMILNKNNIKNKEIIITTTNGTKAFQKIYEKGEVIALSNLNIKSIYEYIENKNYNDIGVMCAGTNNNLSLEDIYAAGKFINFFKKDLILNDSAKLALNISNQSKDYIKKSDHSQRLIKLGLIEDLNYCFEENVYNFFGKSKKGEKSMYKHIINGGV
ncbi:2-phosphosulfolactate phosphatase [Oceanotoga teriensis]|uniref:2-phosphosulfolactate phosphatase n=1 Tax=Oceanotoga teriensis TaxID=515440 RepID=UPI0027136E46|nr:2-phosphosulfolactate phosphatase [Oceanotoga teriensis]MDO7975345.1 2-phosphosulfolactate phosphatase [Oceanotoga teriensis]